VFSGLTTTAVESPERSFQSFAANHATAGGINEQFLKDLVERGLLTSVSEALDAVLHRINAQSQAPDARAALCTDRLNPQHKLSTAGTSLSD
jgi:hypothetical protein